MQAAFSLDYYLYNNDQNPRDVRSTLTIRHPSEFIVCHDHVEPRVEQDTVDMFFNNGTQANDAVQTQRRISTPGAPMR